jgi:urease alpha subunit
VVDKLIKGGPTTEHEGEEHFNMHLVHGTDNEAEIDVEFITDEDNKDKQIHLTCPPAQRLALAQRYFLF